MSSRLIIFCFDVHVIKMGVLVHVVKNGSAMKGKKALSRIIPFFSIQARFKTS